MKMFKKILAGIVAVAITISGFAGYHILNNDKAIAANTLDESKCVSFAYFSARHDIPVTTIFMGTHLMVLEATTDELWLQAEESATLSAQEKIYYKSEMTNGTWYDITDARSLKDIDEEGTPVSESDLADLLVQYYTFDTGVTRAAIDDSRHCIFDGEYPYYDLYHLDELSELKNQYDILVSRDTDSKMDNFYRALLNNFYKKDLRNDITNTADEQLYALQDVYDALCAVDRKDDAAVIYNLMARIDHTRRAEIFRQLIEDETLDIMNKLLDRASGGKKAQTEATDQEGTNEEGTAENNDDVDDVEDDFITNNDVTEAIKNGIDESGVSYLNHSTNAVIEAERRVLDQAIYTVSMDIITQAPNGLNATMDQNITKLGRLFNIDESTIKEAAEELAIIQNELIGPCSDNFRDAVMQGNSPEYDAAANSGKSESALKAILDSQETDVDVVRGELQDMITALTDRIDPTSQAVDYTAGRIDWTYNLLGQRNSTSAFGDRAANQINSHIDWLSKKLAELRERAGTGNTDIDKLKAEYDRLLMELQDAYDKNLMDLAKELEAALKALQDKIDAENAKNAGTLNDPNASPSEQVIAGTQITEDSATGAALQLANSIKEDLRNGNYDNVGAGIAALGAMGDAAIGLLNDLLEDPNATDAIKGMINEAIVAAGGGTGDGTGDGTGGGTGDGTGFSADDLLGLLANLLGDIDSLSAADLAKAIKAMEMIGRDGIVPALDVAARLVGLAQENNNKYVYTRLNNKSEYVNLATLGIVSGYRYVYSTSKLEATLSGAGSKKSEVYKFKMSSSEVELKSGDKWDMGGNGFEAVYNRYAYAPCGISKQFFNCEACDITKSGYGLCLTSKLQKDAEDLKEELLKKMGIS